MSDDKDLDVKIPAADDGIEEVTELLPQQDYPADTHAADETPVMPKETKTSENQLNDLPTEDQVFEGLEFDVVENDVQVSEDASYLLKDTGTNEGLAALYTTLGDYLHRSKQWDGFDPLEVTPEEYQAWLSALESAVGVSAPMRDRGVARTQRKGSRWTQAPKFEGKRVVPNRPSFNLSEKDDKLTGERARLFINSMMSPGSKINVPLWDSGFWVSIREPSLTADIEFIQRLANERVMLGRESRGTLFSNENVFTIGILYDYALAHIYDWGAPVSDVSKLRDLIKVTDLRTICWALACLLYPQGFDFSQPCTFDPTKCLHVAQRKISLTKLLWVDESRLTEAQYRHMLRGKRNATLDDILNYQKAVADNASNTFLLMDSSTSTEVRQTKVVLKYPTAQENIDVGRAWINDIQTMTEAAFGQSLSAKDRDIYMATQSRAMALRHYAHWVDHIVQTVGERDVIIDDPDTIDNLLTDWSSKEDTRKTFTAKVNDFIEHQGVSIVGFPNYKCPSCGKHHLTPDEGGTIVPLDPVSVFLALQRYRLDHAPTE